MKPKSRDQSQAKKLRAKGFSIKEIAKELNVSKSSVSIWVRHVPLGESAKRRLLKRELEGGEKGRRKIQDFWTSYRLIHPRLVKSPRWLNRSVDTFFDKWTPEMAYVLGYFSADGHMYINKGGSRYIGFTSTDKELIENIKRILRVSNKIEVHVSPKIHIKKSYVLQIGSKKIFNRLLELGLTPRKSLSLTFPKVPNNILNHFVRGYFDGDGCASYGVPGRKNRNNKLSSRIMIRFTSGSKSFLEMIQEKLRSNLNIGLGSLSPHGKNAYDLAYSTQDVIKLYSFLYPTDKVPCLKRKQVILERGLQEKFSKGP